MREILLLIIIFFYGCEKHNPIGLSSSSFEGKLSWVRTFGGSNEDVAQAVIETADGGFAVIGNTKSIDGDIIDKSIEESDIFFLKFDSKANLEWTKTYGGSGDDRGHSLVQMNDGGYFLLGYSKSSDGDASNNEGQHDNWLLRIDADGNLLKEQSFGYPGHDHAYNIIKTKDGGLLFNGFFDVSASRGQGSTLKKSLSKKGAFSFHGIGEFWVHKLNSEGEIEWRNYYGGTNNDKSYDAIEIGEGNFVLVGTSESVDVDIKSPQGSYDIWVVMVDAQGRIVWERSLGGTVIDGANAVVQESNGNIVVLGNSFSSDGQVSYAKGSSDFWLATLDLSGNLVSEISLGGSSFDLGRGLAVGKEGVLWLAGYSLSSDGDVSNNQGDNDILVMRLSSNRVLLNSLSLGGLGLDLAHDIIELSSGKIIVVGETESTNAPFNENHGGKDIFIAQWQ